jgi:hypothetical protein
MTSTLKLLLLIAVLTGSHVASAELYKCKEPSGKTSYQETPCPNEQTQKKLRKDADDGAAGQSSPRTARGEAIASANGEKRFPIERSPSRAEMHACISMHRIDLVDITDAISVTGKVFKRVWALDNGGIGERHILVVTAQEKNRLGYADRISFTCTLRGDNTIDADATKEFIRN